MRVTAAISRAFSAVVVLLLLLMTGCQELFGQTAREYYKEVHDTNGLNPLLMFACFPEKDTGLFKTMGLTRTFPEIAEKKHLSRLTGKDKQMFARADALYVEAFYKGVPREPQLFNRQDKNSDVAWVLEFTAARQEGLPNAKFRATYRINWQTLRYEEEVKFGTAISTGYGKCELIR